MKAIVPTAATFQVDGRPITVNCDGAGKLIVNDGGSGPGLVLNDLAAASVRRAQETITRLVQFGELVYTHFGARGVLGLYTRRVDGTFSTWISTPDGMKAADAALDDAIRARLRRILLLTENDQVAFCGAGDDGWAVGTYLRLNDDGRHFVTTGRYGDSKGGILVQNVMPIEDALAEGIVSEEPAAA
jgi:hypothetical protein